MLHALVHADGPSEDDALLGVGRRALQRRAAEAHGLRRDQDALGVEAVQEAGEALAFGSDALVLAHAQILDEEHVRVDGGAAHLVDLADLHGRPVERRVEERESGERRRRVVRRGAREDERAGGALGRGRPDLPSAEDVAVAVPRRARRDLRSVEARVGLGHREAHALAALDERRKEAAALAFGSEDDDRHGTEDVHVDGRRAAEPGAGLGDRLHDRRGRERAEPRAADLARHGDAEPAGGRDGGDEVLGELARLVLRPPPRGVEGRAEPQHRLADLLELGREARSMDHLESLATSKGRASSGSSPVSA